MPLSLNLSWVCGARNPTFGAPGRGMSKVGLFIDHAPPSSLGLHGRRHPSHRSAGCVQRHHGPPCFLPRLAIGAVVAEVRAGAAATLRWRGGPYEVPPSIRGGRLGGRRRQQGHGKLAPYGSHRRALLLPTQPTGVFGDLVEGATQFVCCALRGPMRSWPSSAGRKDLCQAAPPSSSLARWGPPHPPMGPSGLGGAQGQSHL